MQAVLLPFTPRYIVLTLAWLLTFAFAAAIGGSMLSGWDVPLALAFFACLFLGLLGIRDLIQTKHSVLRTYPISAHLRFLLEHIRPEMRQYFFESETDGLPFSRTQRAVVYQRAKMQLDKRPFGTQLDTDKVGFEWLRHSMAPADVSREPFRIDGRRPGLPAALFGERVQYLRDEFRRAQRQRDPRAQHAARSSAASRMTPAKAASAPITSEGGGDVIWEIGSGYFGCRRADGGFDPDKFAVAAANPQIKMIEIKLSQGAKPGHGGVLPGGQSDGGDRRDPRRRRGQGLPLARAPQRVLDPARADARSSRGCASCRGGKPVGFKLCIGQPWEFLGRLQGDAGDRRSIPISSSSTARRAAPARRRWSSPIISARRCARAWCSCATR